MSIPKIKIVQLRKTDRDKHISPIRDPKRIGTSAYNFVPVNDTLLLYQAYDDNEKDFTCRDAAVNHALFNAELLSGEINCEMELLTELFIGSSEREKFFAPNGTARIPGSTLKGLFRQMVSIVAYGKLNQLDVDRRLFTRPMADMDGQFKRWYNDQLTSQEARQKRKTYTASAGYLFTDGNQHGWFIRPAKMQNEHQFRQIRKDDFKRLTNEKEIEPFQYCPSADGSWLVSTGPAPQKKHEWQIYAPDPKADLVRVSDDDVRSYEKDCELANPSRKIKINLLEKYRRNQNKFTHGIPVFYVKQKLSGDKYCVSFGHTGLFRIAYPKTIGDHLDRQFLDPNYLDLTERIFGRIVEKNEPDQKKGLLKAHASFVSFTDARPTTPISNVATRKVLLAGPKPTSFQNYLVQRHEDKDGKNHWGQGTILRGTKLYWHHNLTSQNLTDQQEKMLTTINPIAPGAKFKFQIHFHNLTDVELGALLTAVQLPPGLAHKIGMGKSLGYGSARIASNLKLYDRKQKYATIFNGESWNCGGAENASVEEYQKIFQQFVLANVGEYEKGKNPQPGFWQLYRMRQLAELLNLGKGQGASDKGSLREQDFKEYRLRKILPIPTDVKK